MVRNLNNKKVKIYLASDHAGFKLKEQIKSFLIKKRKKVLDLGTKNTNSVDYPDFAHLFYYDVGVAVADKIISFSDYVMPVCLPMTPLDDFVDSTGDLLELANWGFYNQNTRQYEVNSDLQIGDLQIYSKKTCNDTQLCIKASDIDPNYFIERPRRSRMIWDLSNNPYDVYFGSNSAKGGKYLGFVLLLFPQNERKIYLLCLSLYIFLREVCLLCQKKSIWLFYHSKIEK